MIVTISTHDTKEMDATIEQLKDEKIPYSTWVEYVGDRAVEMYCIRFSYFDKLL